MPNALMSDVIVIKVQYMLKRIRNYSILVYSIPKNIPFWHWQVCDCGRDGQVVKSLDTCSMGPGIETTFRPVTKCEEGICKLSVILS